MVREFRYDALLPRIRKVAPSFRFHRRVSKRKWPHESSRKREVPKQRSTSNNIQGGGGQTVRIASKQNYRTAVFSFAATDPKTQVDHGDRISNMEGSKQETGVDNSKWGMPSDHSQARASRSDGPNQSRETKIPTTDSRRKSEVTNHKRQFSSKGSHARTIFQNKRSSTKLQSKRHTWQTRTFQRNAPHRRCRMML